MRNAAAVALFVVVAVVGVLLVRPHRAGPPPSPYCRGGDPLTGVYHRSRLHVKSRCRIATGVVDRVKFEAFDGDVHIELRLDDADRKLLSGGNAQVGGNLIVEIIPQDRSRVSIPAEGARVSVAGPWVDDRTHDWMEIHPAWWFSAGTVQPAAPEELRRVQLLLRGVEGAGVEDDG